MHNKMIEINETKKILESLVSTPLEMTKEEYQKWREFAENLRRESNYKLKMSEIKAEECWVYSHFN